MTVKNTMRRPPRRTRATAPGITLFASAPWIFVTLMTLDPRGSVSLDVRACHSRDTLGERRLGHAHCLEVFAVYRSEFSVHDHNVDSVEPKHDPLVLPSALMST
jgi:hypothetical protein